MTLPGFLKEKYPMSVVAFNPETVPWFLLFLCTVPSTFPMPAGIEAGSIIILVYEPLHIGAGIHNVIEFFQNVSKAQGG